MKKLLLMVVRTTKIAQLIGDFYGGIPTWNPYTVELMKATLQRVK